MMDFLNKFGRFRNCFRTFAILHKLTFGFHCKILSRLRGTTAPHSKEILKWSDAALAIQRKH